ncbi:Uncharacterised protein [Escherichia coli]|nr:Uncharacterised protein [Escherichia coli]
MRFTDSQWHLRERRPTTGKQRIHVFHHRDTLLRVLQQPGLMFHTRNGAIQCARCDRSRHVRHIRRMQCHINNPRQFRAVQFSNFPQAERDSARAGQANGLQQFLIAAVLQRQQAKVAKSTNKP